jgi:hypothetical protein
MVLAILICVAAGWWAYQLHERSPFWATVLVLVTVATLATAIALFKRLMAEIEPPDQTIRIGSVATRSNGRVIPWHRNGETTNVMALTAPSALRHLETQPAQQLPERSADLYTVPTLNADGTVVRVEMSAREVLAFLDEAWRRNSYQFSRRYWTQERRPPLGRQEYQAYVRLLDSAGLIAGRGSGASGWLAYTPRQALLQLRNTSQFRAH